MPEETRNKKRNKKTPKTKQKETGQRRQVRGTKQMTTCCCTSMIQRSCCFGDFYWSFFFWGGGGTTEEQSSPPTAPDLDRKPTEFLRVSFPFYGFINWTVGRDDLRFDSTRVDQYCVFNGNLTVTKGTLKISRPISEISIKYQKKLY